MQSGNSHAALIHDSLEHAVAHAEDIAARVYARYFAAHPDARALFGSDDDDSLKGEMLSKLIVHVMDFAEGRGDPDLIASWAADHIGYGVPLAMFPAMFASIKAAVREAAGTAWSDAADRAWDAQIASLMAPIDAAYRRFGKTGC